MCFQVLRAYYTNRCKLELLEHNWAWIGHHILGAKRMDEIEDLKMMFPTWTRFPSWSRKVPNWRWNPSWIRIPSWNRFPSEIGIPRRWRFLLKQGFLLEVGKLNPNGIKFQQQRSFPSPRRKRFPRWRRRRIPSQGRIETCFPNARRTPKCCRTQMRSF